MQREKETLRGENVSLSLSFSLQPAALPPRFINKSTHAENPPKRRSLKTQPIYSPRFAKSSEGKKTGASLDPAGGHAEAIHTHAQQNAAAEDNIKQTHTHSEKKKKSRTLVCCIQEGVPSPPAPPRKRPLEK